MEVDLLATNDRHYGSQMPRLMVAQNYRLRINTYHPSVIASNPAAQESKCISKSSKTMLAEPGARLEWNPISQKRLAKRPSFILSCMLNACGMVHSTSPRSSSCLDFGSPPCLLVTGSGVDQDVHTEHIHHCDLSMSGISFKSNLGKTP